MTVRNFGDNEMKKRILSIVSILLLTAIAVSTAGCATSDIYGKLYDEGYTVKVIYDVGGAHVNETQNNQVRELYRADDTVTRGGKTGIPLLEPTDPLRGETAFKLSKIGDGRNFFQIGWYRTRTLRTDESGRALDIYGGIAETTGKEQAYIYSDKWDFDRDVIEESMLTDGEFTLYAAWAPYFNYEFYAVNADGCEPLDESFSGITLRLPEWNERRGRYNMKDFPKLDGKEFVAAYLDEALTEPLTEDFDGSLHLVDGEMGIANTFTVKIYTVWRDAE